MPTRGPTMPQHPTRFPSRFACGHLFSFFHFSRLLRSTSTWKSTSTSVVAYKRRSGVYGESNDVSWIQKLMNIPFHSIIDIQGCVVKVDATDAHAQFFLSTRARTAWQRYDETIGRNSSHASHFSYFSRQKAIIDGWLRESKVVRTGRTEAKILSRICPYDIAIIVILCRTRCIVPVAPNCPKRVKIVDSLDRASIALDKTFVRNVTLASLCHLLSIGSYRQGYL